MNFALVSLWLRSLLLVQFGKGITGMRITIKFCSVLRGVFFSGVIFFLLFLRKLSCKGKQLRFEMMVEDGTEFFSGLNRCFKKINK